MKSKTEDTRKKEKCFWTSEYVEKHAKNYSPWYKGIRSLPYFWHMMELIGVFIWSLYVGDLFAAIENIDRVLLIVLPLWIFSAKGYRWSLYTGCGLEILILVNGILKGLHFNYYLSILFVMFFISAIRIENYRIKHNLSKKHTILKDCLIALCPVLLCFIFCGPAYNVLSDSTKRAGFWYKGIKGYEIYCLKQGYQMKFFPTKFKDKFSDQISKTDKTLRLFGLSVDELWRGVENEASAVDFIQKAVAQDIETIASNIEFFMLKTGSKQTDQNQVILEVLRTPKAICQFMDENATLLIDQFTILPK